MTTDLFSKIDLIYSGPNQYLQTYSCLFLYQFSISVYTPILVFSSINTILVSTHKFLFIPLSINTILRSTHQFLFIPVPMRETVSTDQCATQCTATSKFNYEPGTTYEFEYDTTIRTSLEGAAEDFSGVDMSAIVHMEFTSKCELTMRVRDFTTQLF